VVALFVEYEIDAMSLSVTGPVNKAPTGMYVSDFCAVPGACHEPVGNPGADVPAFIFGRTAFAEGIGERLRAIRVDPAWYLVVVPQVAVSTAEIFAAPELTRNTKAIKIAAFSVGQGHNDLQPVACRRYPEIAHCLEWLAQFGRAAMSGSGACVFCSFDDEAGARAALEQLPADMKGFVARGLDRHPLYAAPARDAQFIGE